MFICKFPSIVCSFYKKICIFAHNLDIESLFMNKETLFLLIKFFALSFGILFLVSPDSYTHDIVKHVDPAWFFTCGKAWMNGMIPYVDFADSKGLLLWLIYGIGYLISPYNFIGVFWLSVLLYTGVFYYVFKTARIFLKDDCTSFLVTILMLLSFFCPWFHHEIRSEDWCQLFISVTFYHCCKLLYGRYGDKNKECYKACFVIGLSMAGTLLIKYTITAMLGIVACYILYAIIKQKLHIFYSFLFFLSGVALLTVPFVVYMIYSGCFGAFIQEYFLNTLQTVQSSNTITTYYHEWLMLTHNQSIAILFALCIAGTWMMSKLVNQFRFFFIFSFMGFYAISIHHYIYYYLCSCLFFPIFFIIPIVERQQLSTRKMFRVSVAVFGITVFMNSFDHGFVSDEWFFKDNADRTSYYKIAYIMSSVKNPNVVHYVSSDHGLGVPVGILPGTKYWSYQTGATPEMKENQENSIRSHRVDFVVNTDFNPGFSERDTFILSNGYHIIFEHHFWDGKCRIYTKHKNPPVPPDNFRVSKLDILLKRNLFKE